MSRPNDFTVRITDRALSRSFALEGLRLEVSRYSFSTEGGPKNCVLKAYGDEKALRNLFSALRGELQVLDDMAEPVWWGCVWSVVVYNGAVKYGRTLDGMGTSINIIYLLQSINQTYSGAGSQATTGFSSDATAVADYGTIQKRIRGSNGSDLAAIARQARELGNRKSPQRILGTGERNGEVYAEIICKGWFETLDWRYYTNTSGNAAGFEQNAVLTSEANQVLGRAHPAYTGVAFESTNQITNTPSYWALDTASYIYFTGSPANSNIAWTITTVVSAGGRYTVSPASVTTEVAGASVVTIDIGTKLYQTFTITTAFFAAAIDIRCAKNNTPTDNITVKLYTDSAGAPGVLQATGTISNSEVVTYMSWATAVLDSQVSLAVGTTYGIEISRSGSSSLNCFNIGVDTALSYSTGTLKLYAGATLGWKSRPTNADLIFKVAGVVETTTQITSVISGVGEFVTATSIDNVSSLRTVPYQDGTLTARQVILNLLEYGTSGGYRLLCKVDINRRLVVYQEPDYNTSSDVILGNDGLPRRADMSIIPSHKCPYGVWVKFEPLEFLALTDKYLFVDEAEYNVDSDTWRVVRVKDRASDLALTRFEQ